ncbi:hypothetical protein LMG29542_01640 [Paraburkholderia humisilvae]|uniref:Uncharacterized protein n=1 Tax=Paraburkholderia humisilvae TaxID=627669 RepID=A0A6J5DF09_9BURK|nr:hypothetical protein LMG29542_01640 [Paraburkholderia humisilvae]
MKEPRKISAAQLIWLVCFLLLCLYPPTLFGKVLGLVICAVLVKWYLCGPPRP